MKVCFTYKNGFMTHYEPDEIYFDSLAYWLVFFSPCGKEQTLSCVPKDSVATFCVKS